MVDESKFETLSCVGAAVGAAGAQYTTARGNETKTVVTYLLAMFELFQQLRTALFQWKYGLQL